MMDLILPNTALIIKEMMKKEEGGDSKIILSERTNDYEIYTNGDTKSRYLVQCSKKYDLFGFQNYKESFPVVDTYIYLGTEFIFVHFAELLIADFKSSKRWSHKMIDGLSDESQWWTSSIMLFEHIGGIIYDYRTWELVDRDL